MNEGKFYSKKDISKILAKASEIQTRKDLYGDKEGLSKEELLEVANEVGIDEDSLNEALQNYDFTSLGDTYNWFKATSRIQNITNVEGEITDKNWENIVQEIRKITGGIGKVIKTGNSYEWEQRRQNSGYKHISLTPDNGKTKIQFVNSWGGFRFFSTFISCMIAFTVTSIALDNSQLSDLALLIAALSGVLIGFPISRIILHSHYKKQKEQIENLIGSITGKLNALKTHKITIESDSVYNEEKELKLSSSKTHS